MRKAMALASLLVLSACPDSRSSGGDGTDVHCNRSNGTCSQVSGTFSADDLTAIQADCTTNGGSYAAGACSIAGAIDGYCFYPDYQAQTGVPVADAKMSDYYYAPPWDDVSSAADCSGLWQGGAEPNDSIGTATPLTLDTSVSASIASSTDEDFYVFTVPSGGLEITFQTFDATGSACTTIDPWLDLLDAGGAILWSADDEGINSCENVTLTLTEGTYYADIGGYYPSTFSYVLATSTGPAPAGSISTVSCHNATSGACQQYAGRFSSDSLAMLQNDCSGTFAASACPTADAVSGHCFVGSIPVGSGTTLNVYLYAPDFTSDSASTACTSEGYAWIP